MHTQHVLQALAREISTTATGQALFRSLAKGVANALAVDYVFVGECSPAGTSSGRAPMPCAERLEVFCVHGQEAEETPCGRVGYLFEVLEGRAFRTIPAGVQKLFPHNPFFQTLDVDGYAGVSLLDEAGAVTGLLSVMHRGPLPDVAAAEGILAIAAKRAEGELVRARL